jgi:cytochrome P450
MLKQFNSFVLQVISRSAVAMAFAQEVLRHRSPVFFIYRCALDLSSFNVGDIAVPAGTSIALCPLKVR